MYKFKIIYQHITGPRDKQATSAYELSIILDALLSDPEVSDHTIQIITEEK
jgi:hypothetical protein